MSSDRRAVAREQIAWARMQGYVVDDTRGYLPSVRDNLHQAMSPVAQAGLSEGSGGELLDRGNRPAKMRALLSSAALAVNVFDYWTDRDQTPLQVALGVDESITEIAFERKYPTGLGGTPPNLDVVLSLHGGDAVAIESKYCEWMAPQSPEKPSFAPAYFPEGNGLWHAVGLDKSQALANALAKRREQYRHLNAAQLLKYALGLARTFGAGFQLWYVYSDWPSPAGDVHCSEIDRFAEVVGAERRFHALSYQQMIDRLSVSARREDAAYLDYLRSRYSPDPLAAAGGAVGSRSA